MKETNTHGWWHNWIRTSHSLILLPLLFSSFDYGKEEKNMEKKILVLVCFTFSVSLVPKIGFHLQGLSLSEGIGIQWFNLGGELSNLRFWQTQKLEPNEHLEICSFQVEIILLKLESFGEENEEQNVWMSASNSNSMLLSLHYHLFLFTNLKLMDYPPHKYMKEADDAQHK